MAAFHRLLHSQSYASLYRRRSFSTYLSRSFHRKFSSESSEQAFPDTKCNFSCPGYDSESDSEAVQQAKKKSEISKKLPPPYDPFRKKSKRDDKSDPKDLQHAFHKMRTEGLQDYAAKMFDGLSKDGLTHEALELFRQITDKGQMPDVVAHTAVIEAYANAGQSKEALRTFMKMLASGVAPNAYTYMVLLKVLAENGMLKEARKYLLEMISRGIRPNASTYTAVLKAYVKDGKSDEARAIVIEMKDKGFSPDESTVQQISTP